ncbi:hypothetical protein FB45DRAFT_1079060 [Roridomyces roridus]|uniref:F-box domain-containing protein n=1 Tax=Roridomyces roridus TaxID=1738132 RepID=A0AAD7CKT2_9AGAR|nr:hypothetical protein FB45DRAFT_1079060 [Roridomyces roridus]
MRSAGFATGRHRNRRVPQQPPVHEVVYRRSWDFAPLKDFPEELLDRICSFMDTDELCKTMHVCSSLRRVASPHLLFRLGISQCDIQTGTVKLALSRSLHLIVFVVNICPIQRLECFENSRDVAASKYQRLALILRVTAPIPDILIYDHLKWEERNEIESLPLRFLSLVPQSATDTLVIVLAGLDSFATQFSHSIHVSQPRAGPHPTGFPSWISRDPEYTSPGMLMGFFLEAYCLILVCLAVAFYNVYTITRCILCRAFGCGWSFEERIIEDVHPKHLWFHGIRVQNLANKYTLVTDIVGVLAHLAGPHFLIKPLRGIPESVYSAFLASLDFQFIDATVDAGSNVTLADIAAFVARQNTLRTLGCGQHSIRYSSLISTSPFQYHVPSKIAHLSAQASYIPHLLPLTPNVERIYISFISVSNRLIGPWVFNFFAYCTALEAIARLPGSHSLAVSFTFNLAAAYLPWEMETSSDDPQPETQLHRVEHLMLRRTQAKGYSDYLFTASTIRALLPWLARFLSLRRVSFDKDSVEAMSYDERLKVAAAIAAVCSEMSGAGDVAFEIAEHEQMGKGYRR